MSVGVGTRLGPYEILAPIGAGGMGEVYRARDAKLNRDVAIKILPEALAADAVALARFEREAQAVAALSHPNILAIFDFGVERGTPYAVMELLEGQTLRDQMGGAAVAPRKAVEYALQIAAGLAAAHARGITHRDLKPENVFVTRDGHVKLLDFGLAKQRAAAAADATVAATRNLETGQGTVLGTVGYMAPEQLRGQPVDPRSDIFAFGAVLYEMLAGRRAFQGATPADTASAVLKEDPPELATTATAQAPPALDRIVRRCLQKNPDERFQSVRDVAFALEAMSGSGSGASPLVAQATEGSRSRRTRLPWGLAVAAILLAATLAALYVSSARQREADASRVVRAQVVPRRGERLNFLLRASAISPDGTRLAYVVSKGATTELRLRSLESGESAVIQGTEGAYYPFFSPDGKWIAFASGVKLKKVAVSGGSPIALCEARFFRGGVWADDGWIYFVPNMYVPIFRIKSVGGTPESVTRIRQAEGEQQHRWPEMLPGGRVLLYVVGSGGEWDDATIVAEKLDTGERKELMKGGTFPRYLPSGQLVFARAGALYAVSFDARSLEMTGSPVEVARDVYIDSTGFAQMDVSRSGTLVTAPSDSIVADLMLSWVDRAGRAEALNLPRQQYFNLAISPDGTQVTACIGNTIGVADLVRLTLAKLTLTARAENPVWSGDGRRIFFALEKGPHYQVFWKAADDSGSEQLAFASDSSEDPLQMSADGSRLLTVRTPPDGQPELLLREVGSGAAAAAPKLLVKSPFVYTAATLAPGGTFVAYQAEESGRGEIYVRPTSGRDRKWQISSDGGTSPVWSADGKEIFYLCGMKLMAVGVEPRGEDLRVGTPKVLFENHEIYYYDVARDGRKFFVAENPSPGMSSHLDLVVNWVSEVARKVQEARVP